METKDIGSLAGPNRAVSATGADAAAGERSLPLSDDRFNRIMELAEEVDSLKAVNAELLEALKQIVSGLDAEYSERITDVNFPLARAAIRKATEA